ncbi:hypothetical protein JCM11641_006546 [Rhodosporidiobolus odoratus]
MSLSPSFTSLYSLPTMPSAKPPPPPAPGQPQLRFTSFAPVGYLNAKNVASSYSKSDSQSWFARRSSQAEWDAEREGKRRRLMASEEEIAQEGGQHVSGGNAGGEKVKVGTLLKAPAGAVRGGVREAPDTSASPPDPQSRTIIIHPGSRFLRIGLASSLAPVAVPNVIARKLRNFVPGKGKQREDRIAPTALPGATALDGIAAPTVKPEEVVAQAQAEPSGSTSTAPPVPAPSFGNLPALPGFSGAAAPAAPGQGDVPMSSSPPSSSPVKPPHDSDAEDHDAEDHDAEDGSSTPRPPRTVDSDPFTAKISSLRADLRARMRIYKLRGQGNGNSQAAAFNQTVVPQTMEVGFEGDVDWTIGQADCYVGNKAVRIPDAEASGYQLRRPYDRGGFNTLGYSSQQELLGDIEAILVGALEEELGIKREELKDYSVIFLIPDLYDATYVREMTDLLLRTIGFKQTCLQQEAVCATFGAGVTSACVVDIGAKTSTITCVEEGLVLPETRMVLDFGGDDITSFLLTLLLRTGFPYKEADLSRWYDWTLIEDLKERLVVLSEGDISLNLYDFYLRRPGLPTRKYSMRVYDDAILAPYALFAPRVIDFEQKKVDQPELWSKDVVDNVEFGAGGTTNAMRNSTSFLLAPTPGVTSTLSLAPPTPVLPTTTDASSHAASPAPSLSGTPVVDDPSSSALSTLPSGSALPSLPLPATTPGPASASPAPQPAAPAAPLNQSHSQPQQVTIDVRYESSKLPLDVAVVESILAAGPAEERLKKVAANLIIVGGTGGIHNIGFAVQSRVAPSLSLRAPSLPPSHLTYIPSPKELEPENVAWKGISALPKLEAVANELWIRRDEWEGLGMRAGRERGFYWA